ncbi:PIH1 domain-containing protein 2-like [Pecten maximus]|uniref:PIH1 domain-containing protein 2-like n=1 Tax=Pecten maximus TaxID=6579 RepID=UPI0014587215|nr:PIH1 domain-containing protein 2-like [Pecten maximus]XP_033729181.1 PIH1 domain-containing protein 2-like [Pecten maximus]
MDTDGKADSDSMMHQAQHIWSMLDDMANSDPKAYKNFIDKHIKEGQEFMSPPTPHMCVQTMMLPERKTFFINFCSWARVPVPKSPEDAVPVTGTDITEGRDKYGFYSMTSCAFNPKVIEEYGHDTKSLVDRETLINLAIDFIQHQHKVEISRSFTLLSKDIQLKGEIDVLNQSFSKKAQKSEQEFEEQLSELETSFGPLAAGAKNSLLNKLANISTEESRNSKKSNGKSTGTTYDSPTIKMPNQTEVKKAGIIEEISSQSNTKLTCPVYTMDSVQDDGGNINRVVVKIQLPGVKSVNDCQLDISKDDLQLTVENCYDLHLVLPCQIMDDDAVAKFSKKASVLTVTLPAVGKL